MLDRELADLANTQQPRSSFLTQAAPAFDEFQILRFRAENTEPFAFEWVDYIKTAKEYGALLVRLSREYDRRFN